MNLRHTRYLAATAATAALILTACSDPAEVDQEEGSEDAAAAGSITVGSAAFPENEIIAEVYAQALESGGYTVERSFQIGAREVYLPAMVNAEVDVLPEYTGNLLSAQENDPGLTSAEDIEDALPDALPEGLEILQPAPAENKDSLNVTPEFSEENGVTSIPDLADLDSVSLAANPEFAERSYGIPGMESIYGITDVDFTPINDGGGPGTLRALLDGTVDVADIYTTTPSIAENDLVTLEDPEDMIAAQHVVPLIRSEGVDEEARSILDQVSEALTTEALVDFNARNSGDNPQEPAQIAEEWLAEQGIG